MTFCLTCLQSKRAASFRTRTVSTVAMIAGFLAIIYMGHVPLVLLVLTLQVSVCSSPCGGQAQPMGGGHLQQQPCKGHMALSHASPLEPTHMHHQTHGLTPEPTWLLMANA